MLYRRSLVVFLMLAGCVFAAAKDKKKILLPDYVLRAETALVIVDPDAGMDVGAPTANRTAREDVEKALMNWGRFRLVMEAADADLVFVVRRGNGKIAQPTIGGVPNNNRPVVFAPADSGGRVGGHTGRSPNDGGLGDDSAASPHPTPQVEVGPTEDTFTVYQGNQGRPLDSPPVWRYTAKGALTSPGVPAVDVFRNLIAEAEKQRAAKP
jgi:hypothetical protein